MSVIDSSLKFVGINPDYPTAERKSAQVNSAQEVVNMQDIIDTVNNATVTNNEFPADPLPLMFVDAATVGPITPVPNYDNGDDGVGATLIGSTNGALRDTSAAGKIDSYTPVVGSLLLIKNQVVSSDPALNKAFQNGLYVVDEPGNSTTPYQLTRLADYDEAVELHPLQINVLSGNGNKLKYFIQSTVNPEIGVSNLIFPVSALQPALPQIAFVDTVIDTPLDNVVYANGSSSSTPGSGATLTSTVNGALGTWNGLTATLSNNDINGFRRVLLINQDNPAHNGDYSVILTGSSTTIWQLRRIQNSAVNFDRYTRFFVVSNAGSTKAGNMYFTRPNATPLTNNSSLPPFNTGIGIAPIDIFEYGGASTLQEVSDSGGLANGSTIRQGSFDRFGLNGIETVCSEDKRIQFANGVEYYYPFSDGKIVQANSMNANAPDTTYDETQGFQVGSFFNDLKGGKSYICTDSTEGAAVWLPMGGQYECDLTNPLGAVISVSFERACYSITNGIVDVNLAGAVTVDFSTIASGSFEFTLPIPAIAQIDGNVTFEISNQINGIISNTPSSPNQVRVLSNDILLNGGPRFVASFKYKAY